MYILFFLDQNLGDIEHSFSDIVVEKLNQKNVVPTKKSKCKFIKEL